MGTAAFHPGARRQWRNATVSCDQNYGNGKITTMLWMWLAPRAAGLVCVCVVSVVVKIEFHNLVMTELLEQILGTMYQQTLGTMYP